MPFCEASVIMMTYDVIGPLYDATLHVPPLEHLPEVYFFGVLRVRMPFKIQAECEPSLLSLKVLIDGSHKDLTKFYTVGADTRCFNCSAFDVMKKKESIFMDVPGLSVDQRLQFWKGNWESRTTTIEG